MNAEPAPGRRTVAYLRKSRLGGGATARQYEDISIENQEAQLRAFCEREGLDLLARREERHTRAELKTRVVLMGLLEECRQGRWDVVVCLDPTRWAGDPDHAAWLRVELLDAGVALRFVRDDPGEGDEAGLLNYVGGYTSKKEYQRLGERSTAAKVHRVVEERRPLPHPSPYGYRWNHEVAPVTRRKDKYTDLHVHEPEALVVRRMYRLVADGASSAALARRLNAEGVPGPQGGIWRQGTIARLLRSVTYLGHEAVYQTRRQRLGRGEALRRVQRPAPRADWHVLERHHPALVDDLTFERVQRTLAEGRSAPRGRPAGAAASGHGPRYLLVPGLAVCAGCGGAMVGRCSSPLKRDARGVFGPGESVRYYACPTTNTSVKEAIREGRRGACSAPGYIRADVLDRLAWDRVKALGLHPPQPPAPTGPPSGREQDRRLRALGRQRALLTRRLAEAELRSVDAEPERRGALDAIVAATVAELRSADAQREALLGAERDAAAYAAALSAFVRLVTEHQLEFARCEPWGADPGQDEEMRAVLRALRVRAEVRRHSDLAAGEAWAVVRIAEYRSSSSAVVGNMTTRLAAALLSPPSAAAPAAARLG
jgi:hypothetical protein